VRALRLLPPRRAHDQCHDPRAHRRRAPARQWPLAPAGVALLPRVSHRGSAGLGQAVYATGGARTPGWQAESQTGLLLTRVCASPWTDGLQTGMVSLLVKAAAFHAPCSQAPYKLQEKFGDMQVVGGDASRPAQPNPRLLLANFNQQTVGVCQRGLEPPGAGRQGAGRVWSAAHAFEPRLGQSHVYSFVPRRALQHDSVWEVEYALYGSRIWCVRDHVHASRCHMTLVPCDTPKESCDTSFV